MRRRSLLKAALALSALGLPRLPAAVAGEPSADSDFSPAKLRRRAQALAQRPYRAHTEKLPDQLTGLDPVKFQHIRMQQDDRLFANAPAIDVQVGFNHVGMHFDTPVRMNVVDPATGRARRIPFRPGLFDYGGSGVDPSGFDRQDLGFAGFNLAIKQSPTDHPQFASFLGASYFRAVDSAWQYGLSARGLAIDVAKQSGEEFPDFIEYWFVRPASGSKTITVYALLDSPSAAGAYRFDIAHVDRGVTMDVEAYVYPRSAIDRLGVAPMTSMFLKGVAQPQARDTVDPRIHDSDRLVMWRGNGEWVCRPLYNPPTIQYNLFQDRTPKGFGLIQHSHDFADYRDTVAWYNRRPSLWVEPKNDWGDGAIALLELPTVGETVDNITAFWVPDKPVEPDQALRYDYTLYWYPKPPVAPSLAHVDQTHSGMGRVRAGWIPGDRSPQGYARRFAVDFTGGPLADLAAETDVGANVQADRGRIENVVVRRLEPIDQYRAEFDWYPTTAAVEPVTLRCYLRAGGRPLSITWLYQWVPPKPGDRHY